MCRLPQWQALRRMQTGHASLKCLPSADLIVLGVQKGSADTVELAVEEGGDDFRRRQGKDVTADSSHRQLVTMRY